ncbi:MAG: rhomboid family intramembrane serine protease, partial [Planctomycetota bacterium]
MSVEARSSDPATPAGSNGLGKEGRRRRPRRRARGTALRAVGRKMALFAAANAVISLFLPWMVSESRGVNAFALGSEPLWLMAFDAMWVARAVWVVLGSSVLVAVLVLVDRVRSLGTFPGFASLAAGGGMMFLAVMVFESVLPLRQLGVIACGVAGLVMVGSGALLFRAKWRPLPAGAESALARPRELPWVTVVLVALNVLAFVTLAYRSDYERRIVRELGLIAGSMRAHAFVTCMFLHADAFHLFANMAVLVAVGGAIERRSGRATFALVYLVSGL